MFEAAVFFKYIYSKLYYTIATTFAKNMGKLKNNCLVRGVIDTADQKIGGFKVKFLGNLNLYALTRISGVQMELFEKTQT
jgi:hypothetical protein